MNIVEEVALYLRSQNLHHLRVADGAKHFGMSATKLRKCLAEENSNFEALLMAERKRRIRAAFSDYEEVDAKKVSVDCGYTTTQDFYRAFKRLFGTNYLNYKESIL